jgi:glycosyltransferase involved in cell wall biosynthesis
MSAAPTISVVIPCYNGARYIGATLRSVVAQSGVNLEVIVVDDGSSDASADLVEREFPDVRVIRQSNQGVAAARNLGVRSASHDWVAFIDADDIWLPGKLQTQWRLHMEQPQAHMSYTAWHVWSSDTLEPDPMLQADFERREADPIRRNGPSGWIYPELLLDCSVWTSTVLVRRALLVELGGFDTELRIGEDYDLWLRASRRTQILRVDRAYALYRLHQGNVTKSVPSANHKGAVIERALARWGYRAPDGRSASRRAVARGLARSWGDFGSAHLLGGQLSTARAAAARAILTDPLQALGWTVLARSLMRSVMQRIPRV